MISSKDDKKNRVKNKIISVCGNSPSVEKKKKKNVFFYSVINIYFSFTDAFVRVTIEKSEPLYHISAIVGWVYFLAWSVSFYPQIYINYKRKSVVGLNFDFLSLNIVGFVMYSLFNCGLYWIPSIEVILS